MVCITTPPRVFRVGHGSSVKNPYSLYNGCALCGSKTGNVTGSRPFVSKDGSSKLLVEIRFDRNGVKPPGAARIMLILELSQDLRKT